MELGNMIFGNSRGEKPIPRNTSFEGPWEELCETLKINHRGYPDKGCKLPLNQAGHIDTPVFRIRSYDWDADCDCGFEERADKWHDANPHSDACYDTVMDKLMEAYDQNTGFKRLEAIAYGEEKDPLLGGMNVEKEDVILDGQVIGHSMVMTPRTDPAMKRLIEARDLRNKYQDEQRKRLCGERGLSYPAGCAVHCDCYKSAAADKWFSENDHAPTCWVVQPNFLYKPTGFRINWYKYPFRDSYMTPGIKPAEWRKIIRHCIDSARRG